jgi:hypothetical protein
MMDTTKVAREEMSANLFTLLASFIKMAASPVTKGIQSNNSGKVK